MMCLFLFWVTVFFLSGKGCDFNPPPDPTTELDQKTKTIIRLNN